MTVDEFVATRVLPEYRELAGKLRALMHACAPDAIEGVSYDMPVWTINRIFAYFIPNKQGITFSFTYGVNFEDHYGLLRGTGKNSRHVKLRNAQQIPEEALRYYIAQALKLEAT